MNYLKSDNTVMKNKNDNYEINEFGIEPCELEDFEVNTDADDSIVDGSEEEYDEVMREHERKERKKARYSLTELRGIAALDEDNDMSYDDMRMDYLKEKYSL